MDNLGNVQFTDERKNRWPEIEARKSRAIIKLFANACPHSLAKGRRSVATALTTLTIADLLNVQFQFPKPRIISSIKIEAGHDSALPALDFRDGFRPE